MQTTEVVMDEPEDPLLVSVRSGAAVFMPGMMDTVLNLGLNGIAVEGFARRTGDERFARDSYRRFIQMFGDIVIKIDPDKFETSQAYRKHEAARPDPMGGYSPSTSLPQFVRAVFFQKHPEVQLGKGYKTLFAR